MESAIDSVCRGVLPCRMRRFIVLTFLPLLGLTGFCHAENAERPSAEWAAELSAVFAKNSGYIARYNGKSGSKRMNATLGTDRAGSPLLQVVFAAENQEHATRMWVDGATVYLDQGAPGARHADKGVGDMLAVTQGLMTELSLLPAGAGDRPVTLEPRLFLTKSDLNGLLYVCMSHKPTWLGVVKGADRVEVGEEEVVFKTATYGDIAISRKSGLMTRQALEGEDGAKRELVLVDLELNPTAEALAKVRQGWSTEGAKDLDFFSQAQLPHIMAFQQVIVQVDGGELRLERLREVLRDKADFLRSYFRAYAPKLDPEEAKTWKEYIAHAKWEMSEELKAKAGEGVDKAQVEAQLATPEVKARVRESLARERVEEVLDASPFSAKECAEFLVPTTDSGKEAFKLLEEAAAFALVAAEVELRMEEFW